MAPSSGNAFYDEYESYVKKYKKMYGESVVVFLQCGHFYEMYSIHEGPYEIREDSFDIRTVADHLNMAVTRKNKNIAQVSKGNCLMCGFPLFTLSKYVAVLTSHNYTVIVVSQVSPSPNPKRMVTGIYSPGTMVDEVPPTESNYFMSIFCEEVTDLRKQHHSYNIGLSYIDISTGTSFTFETSSRPGDKMFGLDEVYRIILAVNPKEIIILGKGSQGTDDLIINHLDISNRYVHNKFNNFDDVLMNVHYQTQLLKKVFPNHGLLSPIEYLDFERHPLALCSFISMLQFIFNHSESILEKIQKPIMVNESQYLNLSYNTAKQLNIVSTESCKTSLIHILNNCHTAIGKRRFTERILNPRIDQELLEKDFDSVEYFLSGKKFIDINRILSGISDLERQFRKVLLKSLHPTDFVSIKQSMEGLRSIITSYPKHTCRIHVPTLDNFEKRLESLDLSECSKHRIDDISGTVFTLGMYHDIDVLHQDVINTKELITHVCDQLNSQTSNPSNTFFKIDHNDKDSYHLVITKKRYEAFKKDAKSFKVNDMTFNIDKMIATKPSSSSTQVKINHPVFTKINERINTLNASLKIRVTEEYITFLDSCSVYQDLFIDIVNYIGEIDYHCTNASNAATFSYVRPTIKNIDGSKSYLHAEQLRHPISERIQQSTQYIPNDVFLGINNEDGMLLYGINASGKSNLQKSVGLAVVMASAGMYVPCSKFTFYPYKHLFTRIPTGDNIGRGQSTFTNEICELRNIIQRADANSLVIGDELCCGTESISAMSIVSAGIITLCQRKSSFIFATHLHDLVDIDRIKNIPNLKVKHLSVIFDEGGKKLIYDRKLKDGPGKTVYGLEVCKALNLDPNFLDLAQEIRRNILQTPNNILGNNKTKYNSHLFWDNCSICKANSSDIHHIQEQHKANDNGVIGQSHKNSLHNLIPVCKSCHDAIHSGKLSVEGYVQTSDGIELIYHHQNI